MGQEQASRTKIQANGAKTEASRSKNCLLQKAHSGASFVAMLGRPAGCSMG